jgi:hypothetical protein
MALDLAGGEAYELGCRMDGCVSILLDEAVWPRDRRRIEVVSDMIEVMPDEAG